MTSKVWEDIVGLSLKWMMVNDKGLQDASVKFNKVTKYNALMKDSSTFIVIVSKGKGKEIFGISPLLLEHRLLVYVIAWILTLRGSNDAQLIDEDLLVICLMQGKMKLNWVNIVVDNMLKAKRIVSFKCS